jgi:Na+-driven multidrug efflux pump
VIAYGALLRLVTEFGSGEAAHAALAVGFRLDMLATFTGAGWGAAAAAIVGQALGRGNVVRARAAGWMAAAIDAAMMGSIGLAFYVYAPWLMSVFGEDPAVKPEFSATWRLGIEYLRIAVFGYAFAGVGITLAQALNGAGSTKTPLFLDTLVFLIIQIPVAAYVAFNHDEMGYLRVDLWWSIVAVTALAACLYAFVWNHGHWRHKRIQ